jgi:streptogramin lyase
VLLVLGLFHAALEVCREGLTFRKIPDLFLTVTTLVRTEVLMPRLFNFVRFGVVLILLAGLARPLFAGTDFPIPPGRASWPYAMVVGPDNNLWFVEWGGQKVGFITTAGVTTEYPIPNAQALFGIASGPDGNLWFTDAMAGTIGHISTSGTNIVHYSLPAGSFPQGITKGPDGNLWFVEQKAAGDYDIGKITTAGKITSYSTKETAGTFQVFPANGYGFGVITTGPDGNLWFVNPQNELHSQVGKITTTGVVTFYPTSDLPIGLTAGPDGNLWLIEFSHVAKMTTSGFETEYALTQAGFTGIAAGSDGNIWFSEINSNFGKVVPSTGAVTEYASLFPAFEYTSSIVSGPDSNLWFTSPFSDNIGRMTTAASVIGNFALNIGAGSGFNTTGPDGNLWFTMGYPANGVGKMTPEGVVTTYPLPTADAQPSGITAGPDGNVWFLETGVHKIAKVTTSGGITEYAANGYAWFGIITGPDGNLWFPYIYAASCACSAIGRITTSGTTTAFPTTTPSSYPEDLAVGPDGNIWFTESGASKIGKMSTAGVALAEYPTKTNPSNLSAITSGPDGDLWFLENTAYGAVGKITTSGKVTEYKAQMQNFQNGIVSGSDGAIWYAQGYPNAVGRVTTKGVVSTVPLTTLNALGNSLTVGPDHKIWVAEGVAGALGRLSAIGGTGQNFTATHAVEFTGEVASFVDGTPTATQSDFTATIYWGDGAKSAGTITGSPGGPFDVSGSHTYSSAGTFHPYVTFHDTVDNSTYASTKGKATVN